MTDGIGAAVELSVT